MTVSNWERGTERPLIRHIAAIIGFLGYDPEPAPETLPGRLQSIRRQLGLTQADLATRLGQDEGQISRWENGRLRPHPWIAGRIDLTLRALEGRRVEDPQPPISFFDSTRWRRKPPAGLAIRPRTFGERLRARRLRLGLTMDEVASRARTTRGTLYRIERGLQRPSPELRSRFRDALGTGAADDSDDLR